jgi:DNA-binding response OmpR family regulator
MRVLIAEEDDETREKLVAAARAGGNTVHSVADVREAEAVIARHTFDVIVADLLIISLAALLAPKAQRVLVSSVPNMLTPDELHQFSIARVLIKPVGELAPLRFGGTDG